ncbi:hypothetical protein V9T40_010102 [Parthenolecanium corni]|uniref:CCHC-type domain-containing protein n=1 Tax=Parthenolecanium corni TaxID=536013 RepID=A0AAN9Y5V3_9HEMI
MGPLDPALIDNPTPPPSPTVEVEPFAAEVEVETEVRAAAASLNMYGRLDAGLRRVGGSEPSSSSRRRGEANLAESQTSGSAEGEVAQSHPRSSSELGLMGLWRRHRLMSLCDPPLPPSPTLPTQAGHDPLIENHDKPEPMDSLDIPLPIGPPTEANLLSLTGPSEEVIVEPDIPLEAICAHVEEASVIVSAHAPAEVEEGPIEDLEVAPQPQALVVAAEIHEPPPSARIPTPPPAVVEIAPVLPPANDDVAVEVMDIVIVSDDDGDDGPVAEAPVVMLADSPPPPRVIDVVDLLADDPPVPAAALRTPPAPRRTSRAPPRAPRIPLGRRCFNCQRRGHLGNECPYPPAVGRPCFNCGLQGHEIADCPNPAPFAADNRIRLLERQQRLQERELRRLRTRRQLFSPPYSYAHPQLPPLAMWLGPQYPYPPPQPMAPLGWAYNVPRWQVPYQPPAIEYPPLPDDPEFSEPEEGALPVSSNVYGHGGCRQFCIRRMQLLSSDDEVNVIAPGGTFNDLDRNPQSLQEQQQQQQQQKSTLSLFYIAFIKHGRATVIDYHLYSMATQSRISFKFPSCLCCQRRVCTRWSNRSHTGKKATKKLIVKRIQGSCLHMPFECLILKEIRAVIECHLVNSVQQTVTEKLPACTCCGNRLQATKPSSSLDRALLPGFAKSIKCLYYYGVVSTHLY